MTAPFDAEAVAENAARQAEADRRTTPEWRHGLILDGRGVPLPILANVAHVMRDAPELTGLVTYDDMARHTLVTRTLPDSKMEAVVNPRPMTDQDVAAIQEWVQHNGITRVGREVAHQAVDLVAHENSFHPVRDYLDSLRWDGIARLDRWLTYYLGAVPSPYTAAIGRFFLIAMVARIMLPGCKCDYLIVLEGEQGARKSSACAILGGQWFSDNLPDIGSGKDTALHLNGKWLIELAELSATSKADTEELKSFLSRTREIYRPPYGRQEVIFPRQAVFIGTTNQNRYLRDETGGRRFWPLKVGEIDLDALRHDRDQLFAEAVTAFHAGEKWWPDRDFERDHIRREQELRYDVDEWEGIIRDWIADPNRGLIGEFDKPVSRCTMAQVAEHALRLDPTRLGRREQSRIAVALGRLGWVNRRDMHGRRWERTHDAT